MARKPAALPTIAGEPLENQKWERFAQLVAAGSSSTSAYRQVYPDSSYDACRSSSADLLAKPSVSERVLALKQASASDSVLSREETERFLAQIVRSSVENLPNDSPLIQSIKRRDGEVTEIKVPNKLEAIKLNAHLKGWLSDQNHGVTLNLAMFWNQPKP